MAQQKPPTPRAPRSTPTLAPVSPDDEKLIDMREAADVLMEDEGDVAALLADGGVSLVRKADASFVSRRDLLAFRAREIAAQRAGVREITRLSIAAGLDDVDDSHLPHDQ